MIEIKSPRPQVLIVQVKTCSGFFEKRGNFVENELS